MTSFTMHDDSILTTAQIASRIREAEGHLAALERLEKVLGPLHVDAESVRLALRDLKAHYVEGKW